MSTDFGGRGSAGLALEGSERQVEEGWRMEERRRIWERRKEAFWVGIVFEEGESMVGSWRGGHWRMGCGVGVVMDGVRDALGKSRFGGVEFGF